MVPHNYQAGFCYVGDDRPGLIIFVARRIAAAGFTLAGAEVSGHLGLSAKESLEDFLCSARWPSGESLLEQRQPQAVGLSRENLQDSRLKGPL